MLTIFLTFLGTFKHFPNMAIYITLVYFMLQQMATTLPSRRLQNCWPVHRPASVIRTKSTRSDSRCFLPCCDELYCGISHTALECGHVTTCMIQPRDTYHPHTQLMTAPVPSSTCHRWCTMVVEDKYQFSTTPILVMPTF